MLHMIGGLLILAGMPLIAVSFLLGFGCMILGSLLWTGN